MKNKLQFRRAEQIFSTREQAIDYINNVSNLFNRGSLPAEPLVVFYGNDENKNAILAIGKGGDGISQSGNYAEYEIIDIQYVNGKLAALESETDRIDELEDLIQAINDNVSGFDQRITDNTNVILNVISGAGLNDSYNLAERGKYVPWDSTHEYIKDATSLTDADRLLDEALEDAATDFENFKNETSGQLSGLSTDVSSLAEDVDALENGLSTERRDRENAQAEMNDYLEKLVISAITPSSESYSSSYALVDKNGVQHGAVINIAKDQLIRDVRLSDMNATLNTEGMIVDGYPKGDSALVFSFQRGDGNYEIVKINLTEFIEEEEAGNGIEVNNHKISAKADITSANEYLYVSENGIGVSGVNAAIATAVQSGSENVLADAKDYTDYQISEAINALDYADEAEAGKFVSSVSQVNGTISATKSDLPVKTIEGEASNSKYDIGVKSGYTRVMVSNDNNGNFTLTSDSKVIPVETSSDNVNGLAESYNVKQYVDGTVDGLQDNIDANTQAINNLANETIQNIANAITTLKNNLNVSDSPVEGQYVSSVSQVDGKVVSTKAVIPVQGIGNGEQVLSLNDNKLKTSISLGYSGQTIYLLGNGTNVLGTVDTAEFVKDGFLNDVYVVHSGGSTYIRFVWNSDSGDKVTDIPVSQLFTEYTAGNGIAIENVQTVDSATTAEISIKLDSNGENFLYANGNGLGINGVNTAISTAVENEAGTRKAIEGQTGNTYAPNASAAFISAATSLNDADVKLDNKLNELYNKFNTILSGVSGSVIDLINNLIEEALVNKIIGTEREIAVTTIDENESGVQWGGEQPDRKIKIGFADNAIFNGTIQPTD